jgi:hypothetical protein
MADIRSLNIQSKQKVVSSNTSKLTIGGQVPASMKRWITFLRVDPSVIDAKGGFKTGKVIFISTVTASPPGSFFTVNTHTYRKDVLCIRATCTLGSRISTPGFIHTPDGEPELQLPARIDPDKPLFSIAGGAYLGVFATGCTAHVFVSYFDE